MTPPTSGASLQPLPDLDLCAREPIHTPGSIQQGGALVVFDPADGGIRHASANLGDWLPRADRVGATARLQDLIGREACAQVLGSLFRGRPGALRHAIVDLAANPREGLPQALEIVVHEHAGLAFAEVFTGRQATSQRDWMQLFTDTVDALKPLTDLQDFTDTMAALIKDVSGFDRVMVYRFSPEGHGHVMSDAREPEMASLLDLHYPASDIPAQARALYRTNLVRYIADVDYQPVPVLPCGVPVPEPALPLDMSHVSLRSVSPVHLQYLRNMGVQATLTLSLLVDGELWGLIACHHHTPAAVSNRLLRALHPFAFTAGFMLAANLQRSHQAAAAAALAAKREIADAFSDIGIGLDQVVANCTPSLLSIVGASGGVLWQGSKLAPFGELPASLCDGVVSAARQRLAWQAADVVHTAQMNWGADAPADEARQACGLLALRFDPAGEAGIAWVRPALRSETTWGGDPDKPVSVAFDAQGRPVLEPRSSFARWVTVTEGCSHGWSVMDVEAATRLGALRQLLVAREEIDQLSQSDRRLRGLLALQSQSIWQTDVQGRLITLSEPLPCGALPDLTQPFVQALRPWYDASSLARLQQAIDGGLPFRGVLVKGLPAAAAADGGTDDTTDDTTGADESLLEFDGEPYCDDHGKFAGWHGSLRDVARQRRDDEAARQKEVNRLAELERQRFLRHVGHEMRTPLHAVQAFTYLLMKDAALQPQARQRLQRIKNAGDSMLGMVEDLMDIARLHDKPTEGSMGPVEVRAVLMAVVDEFRPAAALRNVQIVVDTPSPAWVSGDAVQLNRVFHKLASNAVKYNRADGEVRFSLRAGLADNPVCIEVSDTGDGMSSDQTARLFQPFDRLGREGLTIEGIGLGLSIARRLLDGMGGRMTVTSVPGQGSCFAVELLRADAPAGG